MPDIFRYVNKKREEKEENRMTSTNEKIEVKEKQPVKTMSQSQFSGYDKPKKKGK
jgi:hypothetical protein